MNLNNKILAIYGSPAKSSFSSSLLDNHVNSLANKETPDIIHCNLSQYNISPCNGCGLCATSGKCVINDDMQKFYPILENCKNIFISSPIYFSSLPSHLKAFIDRTQPLFWKKFSKNPERSGIVFLSAGSFYPGIFSPSITILRHFFNTIGIRYDRENSEFYFNTDTVPQKFGSIL